MPASPSALSSFEDSGGFDDVPDEGRPCWNCAYFDHRGAWRPDGSAPCRNPRSRPVKGHPAMGCRLFTRRTMGVVVTVCGARSGASEFRIHHALDTLHKRKLVIMLAHGGTEGTDLFADAWAVANQVLTRLYPNVLPPKATLRSVAPVGGMEKDVKPDGLVAFPGGRDSERACRAAAACGVPIWRPYRRR